jgi:hypothetical protein
MMSVEICALLKKLFRDGNLSRPELKALYAELRTTLKFAGAVATEMLQKRFFKEQEGNFVRNLLEIICQRERLDINTCLDELVDELIVKLLQSNFKVALENLNEKACLNYLTTAVKNFLIDRWRKKYIEVVEFDNSGDENSKSFGEKVREGEILKDENPKSEIETLELLELEEIFSQKVSPQDLKYFCYHLVSKGKEHYRCLWGDKSKDAIYKDANRKKKLVVEFLEKLRDYYGFDYDIVQRFIRIKLSELCEKQRLEICKESAIKRVEK